MTTPDLSSGGRGSPRPILAGAAAVLVAATVLSGQAAGMGRTTVGTVGSMAVVAALFTAMGALVLQHLPRHRTGLLLAFSGLTATVALVADSWSAWLPLAWASQWTWWPPFGLMFLALLYFPDGRLPSRRWRALAVFLVVLTVAVAVALAVAALDHPRTLATDLTPRFTDRAQLLVRVAVLGAGAALLSFLAVILSLWLRWRRAEGEARLPLACLIPGCGLLVLGLVLDVLAVPGAWALSALALPVAMTVAVLRFHLWGLHEAVTRSVVWTAMALLVVVLFVVLVAGLRGAVTDDESAASLAATGIIAVVFDPLRRNVQGTVRRLVAGDRELPGRASESQRVRLCEEERRGLRRDLQDVAGATLAGIAMQVRAARKAEARRVPIAGRLRQIEDDLTLCTTRMRRFADRIRPPELDLGLEQALRAGARRHTRDGFGIELEIGHDLAGLPAAVEMAAFDIVGGILDGIARGAALPGRCRVRIERGADLTMWIEDGRTGPRSTWFSAVHVAELAELGHRAGELGGTLVTSRPRGQRGTLTLVRLPIQGQGPGRTAWVAAAPGAQDERGVTDA